jgi:NAD(P)-dependent dehydrogenase (short-subunit alcohol dehydrogenase family)
MHGRLAPALPGHGNQRQPGTGVDRVKDKVALITGGGSGIGRAACKLLGAEGARAVVADINDEQGHATVGSLGANATFVHLDVTDEASWKNAVAKTIGDHGSLEILVNCAGIGISGPFEETTLADWNRVMAVNLTGVFLGCKHGVLGMRCGGRGGSIINISSIAGLVGGEDIAAYSASKGGVTLLTKSVALSCARRGLNIRCNSVHPTYVDTEMLDPIAELYGNRDAMRAAMAENVPLGRLARAEDIAQAILFLASDESSMMTGSCMVVDGGTTAGLMSKHSGN